MKLTKDMREEVRRQGNFDGITELTGWDCFLRNYDNW